MHRAPCPQGRWGRRSAHAQRNISLKHTHQLCAHMLSAPDILGKSVLALYHGVLVAPHLKP